MISHLYAEMRRDRNVNRATCDLNFNKRKIEMYAQKRSSAAATAAVVATGAGICWTELKKRYIFIDIWIYKVESFNTRVSNDDQRIHVVVDTMLILCRTHNTHRIEKIDEAIFFHVFVNLFSSRAVSILVLVRWSIRSSVNETNCVRNAWCMRPRTGGLRTFHIQFSITIRMDLDLWNAIQISILRRGSFEKYLRKSQLANNSDDETNRWTSSVLLLNVFWRFVGMWCVSLTLFMVHYVIETFLQFRRVRVNF